MRLLDVREGVLMRPAIVIETFEDAGSVSEDPRASLQPRGRRLPAPGQPGIQEVSVGGFRRPDGDRRHRTESGRIEDEVSVISHPDADVMSVLVLGQDLIDIAWWGESTGPAEHALEASERGEHRRKLGASGSG